MAKREKRRPLVPRSREVREAMALQPLIDAAQDALDRFQVLYEEGGNIDAAMVDFQMSVEDLADGVDKNTEAVKETSR